MRKHEMSIETAKMIGRALGVWVIEYDEKHGTLSKTRDSMDCVAIEESPVWAGFHEEWFGKDLMSDETHVNWPVYAACFDAMYESARDEMYRRGHWTK